MNTKTKTTHGTQHKTVEDEMWTRCTNIQALEKEAIHMGWDSLEEFAADVGVEAGELVGVWFSVVNGRIFLQ